MLLVREIGQPHVDLYRVILAEQFAPIFNLPVTQCPITLQQSV